MNEVIYKNHIAKYLETLYGKVTFIKLEDKNLCFDILIHNKNINVKIEYKCRYFKDERYLKENDILIELFQSLFEIQKITKADNRNINQLTNSHRINTSIGWFYKCTADRLLYLRYYNDELYDIYDIDYPQFRNWFMNNIEKFSLQFSGKTTGTINAKVKFSEIPQNMITVKSAQCQKN